MQITNGGLIIAEGGMGDNCKLLASTIGHSYMAARHCTVEPVGLSTICLVPMLMIGDKACAMMVMRIDLSMSS
jgi:uncharacterized phosphosugar-binding protein